MQIRLPVRDGGWWEEGWDLNRLDLCRMVGKVGNNSKS